MEKMADVAERREKVEKVEIEAARVSSEGQGGGQLEPKLGEGGGWSVQAQASRHDMDWSSGRAPLVVAFGGYDNLACSDECMRQKAIPDVVPQAPGVAPDIASGPPTPELTSEPVDTLSSQEWATVVQVQAAGATAELERTGMIVFMENDFTQKAGWNINVVDWRHIWRSGDRVLLGSWDTSCAGETKAREVRDIDGLHGHQLVEAIRAGAGEPPGTAVMEADQWQRPVAAYIQGFGNPSPAEMNESLWVRVQFLNGTWSRIDSTALLPRYENELLDVPMYTTRTIQIYRGWSEAGQQSIAVDKRLLPAECFDGRKRALVRATLVPNPAPPRSGASQYRCQYRAMTVIMN